MVSNIRENKSVRDVSKVVMYLKRSRGRGLRCRKVEDGRILFSIFMDTAYACHNDAKGHICGIRQEIEEGSIEMPHLPTGEMLSNHAPNVPAKEINC